MTTKQQFKVGDRVVLKADTGWIHRESNPAIGSQWFCEGEVVGIDGRVWVRWDNGCRNNYHKLDLELVEHSAANVGFDVGDFIQLPSWGNNFYEVGRIDRDRVYLIMHIAGESAEFPYHLMRPGRRWIVKPKETKQLTATSILPNCPYDPYGKQRHAQDIARLKAQQTAPPDYSEVTSRLRQIMDGFGPILSYDATDEPKH